jgi:hypothetical protein
LTARELARLALAIQDKITEHAGPVGALKWAFNKGGWEVVSPTVRKTRNGKELDIQFVSPGYVKRVIEDDWQDLPRHEAEDRIQVGSLGPWFVHKVARRVKGLCRVRWCQWLAGRLPTWAWMHEHARKVVPETEYCLCGQKDDIDHRVQGCFVWDNEREPASPCPKWQEDIKQLRSSLKWPRIQEKPGHYICKVNGV